MHLLARVHNGACLGSAIVRSRKRDLRCQSVSAVPRERSHRRARYGEGPISELTLLAIGAVLYTRNVRQAQRKGLCQCGICQRANPSDRELETALGGRGPVPASEPSILNSTHFHTVWQIVFLQEQCILYTFYRSFCCSRCWAQCEHLPVNRAQSPLNCLLAGKKRDHIASLRANVGH